MTLEGIIFVLLLFFVSRVVHLDEESGDGKDDETGKVGNGLEIGIWVLGHDLKVKVSWVSWSILSDSPGEEVGSDQSSGDTLDDVLELVSEEDSETSSEDGEDEVVEFFIKSGELSEHDEDDGTGNTSEDLDGVGLGELVGEESDDSSESSANNDDSSEETGGDVNWEEESIGESKENGEENESNDSSEHLEDEFSSEEAHKSSNNDEDGTIEWSEGG